MMTLVSALLLCLAKAPEQSAPKEDLRPVTLHVAGISCASCAGPVREALTKVPGVKDVEVSTEEKFARFKFDAQKTPVQALMRALLGEDDHFPSRLALQLESPKAEPETIDKARLAIAAVPGVRAMSQPDGEGIVLITFHLDKVTLLPELLQTAKAAGLPMREPPLKKSSRP